VYSPARNNVFAFSMASGSKAFNISGGGGGCSGTLYAPYGQILWSGAAGVVTAGSLVGDTIQVSGSGFTLKPTVGLTGVLPGVALIQ
jgi:hypothetical protein